MSAMAASLLFILYCIEAGIFFVVVPWTRFWALNPLLHSTDLIASLADNGFVRGLITGFGLIHLAIGFREIVSLFRRENRGGTE